MVKIRCADLGGENNHWHFCGSWNIDRMEILQSALLWWIGLSVGCPLVYLGRHDLSTTWKPLDIQYRRDLRHCFPSRCLWENCYGNRSRIGMFQLPSVVRKAALGLFSSICMKRCRSQTHHLQFLMGQFGNSVLRIRWRPNDKSTDRLPVYLARLANKIISSPRHNSFQNSGR